MIVEEPHGLAEHDDERPFGCPYHGPVVEGELRLENGESRPYPQPERQESSGSSPTDLAGRVLALSPPWAQGANPSAEDLAAGRTWPATALFSGVRLQYGGRNLAERASEWVYAEAEGRTWTVTPTGLVSSDQPTSVAFRLTRLGHMGPIPDEEGESWREISIEIPATRPPWEVTIPAGTSGLSGGTVIPGAYPYIGSYKSDGVRRWLHTMFVSDIAPQRGHQAILVHALRSEYNPPVFTPMPILSALLIDLEAGTAESLYLHDPVPHRIPDPETYFLDQQPEYQVPISDLTSTSTFACAQDGETMEERIYEYTHTETRTDTIDGEGYNTYQRRQETLLLAAGFTEAGAVDLVTLEHEREFTAAFEQNLSYSGRRVVHSRPDGSDADCPTGVIEDSRTIVWGMTTTESDVRALVIQSTARGVLREFTSRRDQITHCVPCQAPSSGSRLDTDPDNPPDRTESGSGPALDYSAYAETQGYLWPRYRCLQSIDFDYVDDPDMRIRCRLGAALVMSPYGEQNRWLYHTRFGVRDPADVLADAENESTGLEMSRLSIHPITGEIVSGGLFDRVCWV
ncbi:hypothetical protein SR882_10230 [Guyparkeria halophila]|uniref:Uncharacterized protein n=1 Tax=Guyparkeria halophila TaxID=47960 RepID=A0ABZ0YXV6_9GAMM|nr:hypothetical protein [Guyparkeria halophila]WQH16127.1 hypothetical protein SR882_10230 [Guyparkeria halophila]